MSLVCWSGGADSTLVLYNLLTDPERKRGDFVRTISIRHPQLVTNKVQFEARKRIRAELKKRRLHFHHKEVDLRAKGGFSVEQRGLVQPVLWLGVAMPYLRENEKLYMGYVRGDSMWSWWAHLHRIFKDAAEMLNLGDTDLETPLYDTRKAKVLTTLEKAKLLKLTWTCEVPTKANRACGRCLPCKTRALALYEAKRWPDSGRTDESHQCR